MPLNSKTTPSTIAVIGYGQFGELLTNILAENTQSEMKVISSRPLQFDSERVSLGELKDISACDFIFPCVPIRLLEETISKMTPFLNEKTVVVDVSSVKMYPKKLFADHLHNIPVILTHPMFGPGTVEQLQGNLKGLRIVTENISAKNETYIDLKKFFESLTLDVVEMTAEDHDRSTARFHFLAQYFSQILKSLNLQPGPIDTESYRHLLAFVNMVRTDKRLLFEMMEYNPFCKKQFLEIDATMKKLANELLSQ